MKAADEWAPAAVQAAAPLSAPLVPPAHCIQFGSNSQAGQFACIGGYMPARPTNALLRLCSATGSQPLRLERTRHTRLRSPGTDAGGAAVALPPRRPHRRAGRNGVAISAARQQAASYPISLSSSLTCTCPSLLLQCVV